MDAETQRMVEQATNPFQYDLGTLHWTEEGDPATPWRKECRRVLLRELGDLAGKDILDIGSGTGHLFTLFPSAHRMVGVEPSEKNVRVSQATHPALEVIHASFDQATIAESFDVALMIMSTEHMWDLSKVFSKVFSLLRPGGSLCILTYDFEYAQQQRFGLKRTVKVVEEGVAVIEAEHTLGRLADIVRSSKVIISAAESQGFVLDRQHPFIPSAELLAEDPKRKPYEGIATHQLYIFKKDISSQ